MKRSGLIAAAVLATVVGSQGAEARPADEGRSWSYAYENQGSVTTTRKKKPTSARRYQANRSYASTGRRSKGVGGRPAKWCGWWMRTQKGGGPEYNRAAHWRNYGSSTSARVGAVVVWPHHVGMITGRASDGRWIVTSGNDGGAVRSRARSVSGAVFRI